MLRTAACAALQFPENILMVLRLGAWEIPYMMKKNLSLPTIGVKFADRPPGVDAASAPQRPKRPATNRGHLDEAPGTAATTASAKPDQTAPALNQNSLAPMMATESKRAQAYYHLGLASIYEDDASFRRSDRRGK